MSTTRRAAEGSPTSHERYCSSPEYQHGINATPVAKRCSVIEDSTLIPLIWFLQQCSWQEGGLSKVATEILELFRHAVGTFAMRRIGMTRGKKLYRADVIAIREELARAEGEHPDCSRYGRGFRTRGEYAVGQERNPFGRPLGADSPEFYDAEIFVVAAGAIAAEKLEQDLERFCIDPDFFPFIHSVS